jgi:hypothetical protein
MVLKKVQDHLVADSSHTTPQGPQHQRSWSITAMALEKPARKITWWQIALLNTRSATWSHGPPPRPRRCSRRRGVDEEEHIAGTVHDNFM